MCYGLENEYLVITIVAMTSTNAYGMHSGTGSVSSRPLIGLSFASSCNSSTGLYTTTNGLVMSSGYGLNKQVDLFWSCASAWLQHSSLT